MRGKKICLGLWALLCAGCCGDTARREDILRRRQYELDQREARLSGAEAKFKSCVASRYPGESHGLEVPAEQQTTAPETAGTSAGGVLTPEQLEEIQRVERAGQTSLIACYTQELERRRDKKLEGKVAAQILIGVDGSASKVVIGESTLKAPLVHRCMVNAIRTWEFPKLSSPSWYSTTFSFSPAY
jgi:hypothetical protein